MGRDDFSAVQVIDDSPGHPSEEPAEVLSARCGVMLDTIYHWRRRTSFEDRSHTAHQLATTLTGSQEAVVVGLRRIPAPPLSFERHLPRSRLCCANKIFCPCRENALLQSTDTVKVKGDDTASGLMVALAWPCRSPRVGGRDDTDKATASRKEQTMGGARSYIDKAVQEILQPDFLERLGDGREGLDDFPISQDCWRALWSDGRDESAPNKTLGPFERSRYAYAAARSNLSRTRSGSLLTDPWDEPWIVYFAMTKPEAVAPRQIVAPLTTWWDVYGNAFEESLAFGGRVLDKEMHAVRFWKKGKPLWQEKWLTEIGGASANLWHFVTHHDEAKRLTGDPVAPAIRLINVLALQETLPAFQFMKESGPFWLRHWHRLVLSKPGRSWPAPADEAVGLVADEWASLARTIVGHKVGWIAMLANLNTLPDDSARLSRVMNWLNAYEATGIGQLHDDDPEELTQKARHMPLVADFLLTTNHARLNARAILDLSADGKPWLEEGHFRDLFSDIVFSLGR